MVKYYKVPKDKLKGVLDVMKKTGWTWSDFKPIETHYYSALNYGFEVSVIGVIGKRINHNPDWNHEDQHPEHPVLDFKELVKILNPVMSGSY